MLKEMDSPNTSLKQGHLPFKVLDGECNLPRKRKLEGTGDNCAVEKPMKYACRMTLDKYVNLSRNHKVKTDIENGPSVPSSLKITERINSALQNGFSESKLSPVKQELVLTEAVETYEGENAENRIEEKQQKESLEEEDNDRISVSVKGTLTASDSQYCFDSSNCSDTAITPETSELNKSSELSGSCSEDTCSQGKKQTGYDSPIVFEKEQKVLKQKARRKTATEKPRSSAERIKLREEKIQAKARKRAEIEMEREKKKKLKQEMKENKEKAKLEAKRKKDKERQEKKEKEEREREEKLRHKMEKKEREEKERLEKRQQKQLLLDSKLEEKKKKEEERQRKLDEKRKAEEEEERKKEKAKAAFASFFVKPTPPSSQQVEQQYGLFKPFEVKKDMVLAPTVPLVAAENFSKDRFEKLLSVQDEQLLYLEEVKGDKHKPYSYSRARVQNDIDNDVIILNDNIQGKVEKLHPKLLQFCENVRPPYWGTWRKKSKAIHGRQPLQKDEVYFDYDIDSDEEWDEGGPGESLSGTEDEKESDDDYEVDNEFIVPHGYLSNDEGNEDDGSAVTPETKKALLKAKEMEFNDERSKKCLELKPKVVSCFQGSGMMVFTEELKSMLEFYSAVALTTIPIVTTELLSKVSGDPCPEDCNSAPVKRPKEKHLKKKLNKKSFPEEAMPHFIRLVHGNTLGHQSVIREFREFWQTHCKQLSTKHCDAVLKGKDFERTVDPSAFNEKKEQNGETQFSPCTPGSVADEISKRQLKITLHQIAGWCRGKIGANKYCWWVHNEVREQYKLTDLPIPNSWNYVSLNKKIDKSPKLHITSISNTPSIRKFAKVITVDV